jgi:predicted GNAT superfamily acetyltransferase
MEHDIRLRTAEAADYDRIIAVVDDWWGRPLRHILPRLFLDHFHATSFVAEHGGDLAGFLIGFLSPVPDYDGPASAKMLFERRLL